MPSDFDNFINDSDVFRVDGEFTSLPEPEPREIWCPIISADDHLFESATTFSRVPAKYRDLAPKLIEVDERPAWQIGDRHYFFTGVDGAANRPVNQWRSMKMRLEDYRESVWNPTARLKDMDLNGVWASVCFPSVVWGFAGTTLSRIPDKEASLACVRSYNDWVVEEWWAADPNRYIPCQLPYLLDPEVAADEIRRNAARGVHAVSFIENPSTPGLPSIHSGYWDPFMKACAETETAINLHLGSSGQLACPSPDTPDPAQIALFPVNGILAVVDWIFSGIPERFPDIRVVLSEAGVSWVPMVIERLNRAYRQRDAAPHAWAPNPTHPVDLLRRNFWFTSLEDPSGLQQLDLIGEDHVMLEVDFPHTDSTWPDSQELFRSELSSLATSTIQKVCYANAAKLFHHPLPPDEWIAKSTLMAQSQSV